MMCFRSAHKADLNAIYHLAQHSGVGMTTFPKDKEILQKRLQWSCESFQKEITQQPFNEYYLFVLEDCATGVVVGTAAIEAAIGAELPFYSYKLSKNTQICQALKIRCEHELLHLVNDKQGCSEICTLFLEPAYRHSSNGLLLSRGRFLFMGQYPNRFATTVIAEMRGMSDEWGHSPFWDNVGRHFFQMPFAQADQLTLSTNKQFIADLMPKHSIYVKLLNPAAQAVIGKSHESTLPAMKILLREGFRYHSYIDIFDAGPTIEAPRDQIRTITTSKLVIIKTISDEVSSKRFLIGNTKLDFRATISQIIFNKESKGCILGKETAAVLKVTQGDYVRVAPLHVEEIAL